MKETDGIKVGSGSNSGATLTRANLTFSNQKSNTERVWQTNKQQSIGLLLIKLTMWIIKSMEEKLRASWN